MKEKYTVSIAGAKLTIISEESEEYVLELAKIIDRRITETVIANKRCTKIDALTLCALDYLDSKVKLTEENEILKKKIAELESNEK